MEVRIELKFCPIFCHAFSLHFLFCSASLVSLLCSTVVATEFQQQQQTLRSTTTEQQQQLNYYKITTRRAKHERCQLAVAVFKRKRRELPLSILAVFWVKNERKKRRERQKFATTLALCSLCSQIKEQELEIEKTAAAATAAKSHKSQVSFVQGKRSFVYLFRSEGRPAAAAAISLIYKSNLICGAGALCDWIWPPTKVALSVWRLKLQVHAVKYVSAWLTGWLLNASLYFKLSFLCLSPPPNPWQQIGNKLRQQQLPIE